jgi:hypothetical protein
MDLFEKRVRLDLFWPRLHSQNITRSKEDQLTIALIHVEFEWKFP